MTVDQYMSGVGISIIGKKCSSVISGNLGSGQATYGKVDGVWYSINCHGRIVTDLRWKANDKETKALDLADLVV